MYINHSEMKKHDRVHCGTTGSPLVLLKFSPCQEGCTQIQGWPSWFQNGKQYIMGENLVLIFHTGKLLSGGLSFVP